MNPYRRDNLLSGMQKPGQFIGPQEELEQLLHNVTDMQPAAISLVGPLGSGKSLLLQFLAAPQGARVQFQQAIGLRFRRDPERLLFVPLDSSKLIVANLRANDLFEILYTQTLAYLGELLEMSDPQLLPLDKLPRAPYLTVDALRKEAHQKLQRLSDELDNAELRERFHAAVTDRGTVPLLGLLHVLNAWGLRVIFLFDGFDGLARQLDLESWDRLRDLATTASMVLATRKALSLLVTDASQSSPFFNLLKKADSLNLTLFSQNEAERLIREPPTWSPKTEKFRFSMSDVHTILEWTGRHPDLIRGTCEHLYAWLQGQPAPEGTDRLSPDECTYLRIRLLTVFHDLFTVLWHELDREERLQLLRIANDQAPNGDMHALENLINNGYVVFERGHYRIFAGLFREFIKLQGGSGPNIASRTVAQKQLGEPEFTELEQKVLALLQAASGEIVGRDRLLRELYDEAPPQNDKAARLAAGRLEQIIHRLRNKMNDSTTRIENVRKKGYRLVQMR